VLVVAEPDPEYAALLAEALEEGDRETIIKMLDADAEAGAPGLTSAERQEIAETLADWIMEKGVFVGDDD
jgi:DNA-binding phage protein